MVAEPPTATPAASTSISLVPRQVLLAMGAAPTSSLVDREAKNKKKKKSKKEGGDVAVEDPKESLGLMEEGRAFLLRSIATFLDSNGFSRTLAVFRSEAHLEKDDVDGKFVNLEDILCRFLDLSRTSCNDEDCKGNNVSEKGNESGIAEDANACLGATDAHGDEALTGVKKKKRKNRSTSDTVQPTLEVTKENVADTCIKNNLKEASEGSKAKKKKKIESSSGIHMESEQIDSRKLREFIEEKVVDLKSSIQTNSSQLDESGQCSKTKKKKKHTPHLSTKNAKLVGPEVSKVGVDPQEHDNRDIPAANTVPVESEPNGKNKEKKRLDNGISDQMDGGLVLRTKKVSPCGKQMGTVSAMEEITQVLLMKNDLAGNLPVNPGSETVDNKKKKKKSTTVGADQMDGGLIVEAKKMDSTPDNQLEKVLSMDEATDATKSRKSKRKKRAVEGKSQLDDSLTFQVLEQNGKKSDRNMGNKLQKLDASVSCEDENANMNKKQKTHSIQEDTKLEETIVDEKKVHNHLESNGTRVKSRSDIPTSINAKEITKQSSEPKTVKAFQRVKLDDVKFADERLKDNSYWGKSGADSGYGAKAQDVLGQVKGRDFRHEKTKKKRGSYRGGQIDLGSHSIKFNYSDEE